MEKSKTLISLVAEVAEIETRILESNGEITPEIDALITLNEKELSNKVDSYVWLIKKMEKTESYYRDEADYFLNLANSFERVKDSCNERMHKALKDLGQEEIKGKDYRFKIYKSPAKLVIDDQGQIPSEFLVINTSVDLDKESLKSELKKGPVAGAHLEQGTHVRILPNKG